jgi:hypothetical protein
MAYRDVVLADNPIAYWRFEETSGTIVQDETANNLDGILQATPTFNVVGAISSAASNKAISYPASSSSQYIAITDAANLLAVGDNFTLEAWIKPSTLTRGNPIITRNTTGGGYNLLLNSDNTITLRNGNTDHVKSNITIADTTTWHHIVATKNGGTTKIYIDGVDRTGSIISPQTFGNFGSARIFRGGTSTAVYTGAIDEVAVYSSALSLTRVQAHYNAATYQAPNVPSNLDPSGNEGVATGLLTASVSDPNGDPIASVTIELYDETAAAYVATYTDVSPKVVTTGLEDGLMEHDATAALVVGHAYRWRAKASDGSLSSAFSAWSYFTYGVPPVVTLTEPDPGEIIVTPGLPVTFTYSHSAGAAKIADRVLIERLVSGSFVSSYDQGWVGTQAVPEARTSITLPTGTLRNQEHYRIKVQAQASGGFVGETAWVEFDVAYAGPATLTPTATPDATRAEVLVDWPTSALTTDFGGYEVAVGDPTGTVSTANKTIVAYISDKAASQYTYPFPVSGESKGYYVRQLQVIGPDLVEGNWTWVAATCDFGDRIFVKSAADPYNLLLDFEPLRNSLPTQAKGASQQFLRTWGRSTPVELLGEGREVTGSLEIPFYDDPFFAQTADQRFAILEEIEARRGTVALLLSLPTRRKEFVAIEGSVEMGLDDRLKPTASLNWRRVDYSEDYYAD